MSALAMTIETPDEKVERLNAELRGKSRRTSSAWPCASSAGG